MFLNILSLLKDMLFFTGSYSNNVFPDPLSREEELDAILRMEQNDAEARNKLIEHNLRLVAHIVKKFDAKGVDTDDLISIGTIGLIKGVDSYKHNKNTRITTYAARCIQNEILMHYRGVKKRAKTVSLNDTIGQDKDGNEISLADILTDKKIDICEELELKDNIEALKRYLSLLDAREKEIIIKRYGLLNTKALTQRQIAKELHISRSYVSRIEKRALTKMLFEFIKNKKID